MIAHPQAYSETGVQAPETFPSLQCGGAPVKAADFIERGTGVAVAGGYVAAALGIIFGGLLSYGLLWLVLAFSPLIEYFNRKRTMALIKGSGVQVSQTQFPEIYNCAATYAQRLGMSEVPDIYIVESNTINAAAVRVGGRKVITLMDDTVDACLRSDDPQTICFIVGHELAHHSLGHTNMVRATLSKYYKKLSRTDEFTCDAVANALVGQPASSARAIVTLLTGPQLLKYVNFNQLCQQASEVNADKHTLKAEQRLTHPVLLRRLARFVNC